MSSQDLPLEVVEQVFHYGCAISKHFPRSLCLVSSWARCLALPHLYAAVVLENQSTISTFFRTVVKSGVWPITIPPARHYVRGLWVEPISNVVIDIFKGCGQLEYLSIREENLLWLIRAPLSRKPPSHPATFSETASPSSKNFHLWITKGRTNRWTTFAPVDVITPTLPSPFLSKVTHLLLDGGTGYRILRNIKNFTRLTYLAVTYNGSPLQDLQDLIGALRSPPVPDLSCVLVLMVDILLAFRRAELVTWVTGLDISQKIQVSYSKSGDLRGKWEEEIRTGIEPWRGSTLEAKFNPTKKLS